MKSPRDSLGGQNSQGRLSGARSSRALSTISLIIHNSADHREFVEQVTGEGVSSEVQWGVFES